MAERSNAAASKAVISLTRDRGFESPSLLQNYERGLLVGEAYFFLPISENHRHDVQHTISFYYFSDYLLPCVIYGAGYGF